MSPLNYLTCLTASIAYSTWWRRPWGDQVVTSLSYWFRNYWKTIKIRVSPRVTFLRYSLLSTFMKESGTRLDERNNVSIDTYHFVLYWLNFSTFWTNKINIKLQILHVMLYLLRYDMIFLISVSTDAWWK